MFDYLNHDMFEKVELRKKTKIRNGFLSKTFGWPPKIQFRGFVCYFVASLVCFE